MPIIKVLVDKKLEEKKFFEGIKERLVPGDMVKNPFTADLKTISVDDKMMVLLDLEPLYPDIIPKAGVLVMVASLIFGWIALFIAGLVLSFTFFLWTDWFFFLVMKRARKKQGLKGEIKRLSYKEAFRGVMKEWGK